MDTIPEKKITHEDVKRVCETTCKDGEHSTQCYKIRMDWSDQAVARIRRLRKDVRNMGQRIKRTLGKIK